MTPWQLAKDSESSHQIALFCWLAKAEKYGFQIAWKENSYKPEFVELLKIQINSDFNTKVPFGVSELAFIHHIPNGGTRGADKRSAQIAGGQLKAEGVRAGVWDIFWPLVRNMHSNRYLDGDMPIYPGLYIEMKRPGLESTKNGGLSDEQVAFGNFAHSQGYKLAVCYNWEQAAKEIEKYFLQS